MRFVAILLLTLLSFQTLGYLALILAQIGEVRMEMALLLEKETVSEEIVLDRIEFEKCRSGKHELHVQDALFDIVETRFLPNGKIAVLAVRDQKEQDLLNRLGISLRSGRGAGQRQPAGAFYIKFLAQTFIVPQEARLYLYHAGNENSTVFFYRKMNSAFYPWMQAPPPKRT